MKLEGLRVGRTGRFIREEKSVLISCAERGLRGCPDGAGISEVNVTTDE